MKKILYTDEVTHTELKRLAAIRQTTMEKIVKQLLEDYLKLSFAQDDHENKSTT